MITYRKNTRTGDWNVFGPQSELRVGVVTVHKKDGTTKSERVVSVSKPFDVGGVPHVFGYLENKTSYQGSHRTCDNCGERIHGRAIQCQDSSGIVGYVCAFCADEPWYARSFA
jgi:predicted RNA-binding Zn-ribbon protein involved in translation (DUF1610 family)